MKHASLSTDIGLFYGKTGVAMYAFHAAKAFSDHTLQTLAEKMIDEVVEHLEKKESNLISFDTGLAGIVFGFEYIARNGFISPVGENAFAALDDRIFHEIIISDKIPLGFSGIIGCLFYLYPKFLHGNPNSTSFRYFQRLAIELINRLSQEIGGSEKIFTEPPAFNIQWELPLVLFILGKMHKLNFFERKIRRTAEQLSLHVLTVYPKLHYNRLYLLFGMKALTHLSIDGWDDHVSLLEKNISMDKILHKELKCRSISIKNGIAGISLICDYLSATDPDNQFTISYGELEKKISESDYWAPQVADNIGLLHGHAGMGFALLNKKFNTLKK